jgi:uncharacterized protein YgbK (DUF1537 family)
MSDLRLCFYGDDFTGSTDAMESLALNGVRTVLFTDPPTADDLKRFPGIGAFGVAGMTRAMPADEIGRTLGPIFQQLKASGAPIIHYKTCSTFDSSPAIGSIGRVIDVAFEVLRPRCVPVVVGAPALGRYCVFGNLFARCGPETEPFRLDRHPSMSRHPVTPMDEADLRMHLSKQTSRKIGLLDVLALESGNSRDELDRLIQAGNEILFIDLLNERQLPLVGELISGSRFVTGSSGVESALAAHWRTERASFPPVQENGPILAVCGSCSNVTANQIDRAATHGFHSIPFDANDALASVTAALRNGQSVVIHTRRARERTNISQTLATLVKNTLEATRPRRVLIAGGDTSGHIARALQIKSLEMIGELTRGAPLCRASAPQSVADGIEFTFKGGQIGPEDFFEHVRTGKTNA